MKCEHPPSNVTADILQGDWMDHRVRWCRLCGAVSVVVEKPDADEYVSPWILPRGQVMAKDTRCPKCGNYVPGHATGASDICTCDYPVTAP